MAQLMGGGPKGGPSGGAAAGGLLGSQIGDIGGLLGGLGMSPVVGQDQTGMRRAGLAAGLGNIGAGLMQGGASGGLYDSTGLPSAADATQAAMLRYGMNPEVQSRSQQAISMIPQGIQAPGIGTGGNSSWAPPEYDFTPQAMPGGGGGMGGGGFAGAGMAGRPGGGQSIMDILRMMGSGGGF